MDCDKVRLLGNSAFGFGCLGAFIAFVDYGLDLLVSRLVLKYAGSPWLLATHSVLLVALVLLGYRWRRGGESTALICIASSVCCLSSVLIYGLVGVALYLSPLCFQVFVASLLASWMEVLGSLAIGTLLGLVGIVVAKLVPVVPSGHCPTCRYDLSGLQQSAVCPECGSPLTCRPNPAPATMRVPMVTGIGQETLENEADEIFGGTDREGTS